MTLFTQIFALLFVVFVVGGVFVHLFMYTNGAFDGGKMRWGRKPRLKTASFAQIATISTPSAAAGLYGSTRTHTRKKHRMSAHARVCIVYSLSILAIFIVLIILVLGATQF